MIFVSGILTVDFRLHQPRLKYLLLTRPENGTSHKITIRGCERNAGAARFPEKLIDFNISRKFMRIEGLGGLTVQDALVRTAVQPGSIKTEVYLSV